MQKKVKVAILYRSMKLCMVVEGDSKIKFRSGATAKFIYFWPYRLFKKLIGSSLAFTQYSFCKHPLYCSG